MPKPKPPRMWKASEANKRDFVEFYRTMAKESDRGTLLVGLSEIDLAMGRLLSHLLSMNGTEDDADWLLDPSQGNRPLGSLAVRTRIARCLNQVTDEERLVIDKIREIRNTHAHGTADFVLSANDIAPVMAAWSKESIEIINELMPEGLPNKSVPNKLLIASVTAISMRLHNRLIELQKISVGIKAVEPTSGDSEGQNPTIDS